MQDEQSPSYLPARIDVSAIGSIDSPIRIEFWDFDDDSRHDYLGAVSLPGLRSLLQSGVEYPIINKHRLKHRKVGQNRNNGILRVANAVPFRLPESRPQADPNFFKFQLSMSKIGHGRKLDVVGKGDPFFVIMARENPLSPEVCIYRSELFRNTKECTFQPVELETDWVGGLDASFRVVVYDFDNNYKPDYIGEIELSLRQLTWGQRDYFLQRQDKKTIVHYSGCVKVDLSVPIIRRAVFPPSHIELVLMFQQMRKKEVTRNDPFFTVTDTSSGKVIYTSEVFKNLGSQAMFKPFKIPLTMTRTQHTPLTIEAWDWNANDKHSSIGVVTITLLELSCYKNQPAYAIWHKDRGKKALFKSGLMTVVLYKEKIRGERKQLKNLLALLDIDQEQAVLQGVGRGMEMQYVTAENVSALEQREDDNFEADDNQKEDGKKEMVIM